MCTFSDNGSTLGGTALLALSELSKIERMSYIPHPETEGFQKYLFSLLAQRRALQTAAVKQKLDNGACVSDFIGNEEIKGKVLKKYRKCDEKEPLNTDTVQILINGEPPRDVYIGQGKHKVGN